MRMPKDVIGYLPYPGPECANCICGRHNMPNGIPEGCLECSSLGDRNKPYSKLLPVFRDGFEPDRKAIAAAFEYADKLLAAHPNARPNEIPEFKGMPIIK